MGRFLENILNIVGIMKIIVSKKVSHFMTKYIKLFINVQVHYEWKSFLDIV